jgi:hypothetical protein
MSATSATLDAEWSLLLTACSEIPRQEKIARLRLLLREPIRWKILFDLAARHGTQPLLYQSLVEIGVEIKDAVPASKYPRSSRVTRPICIRRYFSRAS